ncbi:uncharacterized protein LOC129729093 [Wyeomyia smithii]|uniref:uncharacterized protein LOC129729093 n=1 Tax=Wyeomyia smithii TaxID=174621 RepID=UPI002467E9F3|nr:uncharacterized protein LOC129729093 [Wyeomyia smithii]
MNLSISQDILRSENHFNVLKNETFPASISSCSFERSLPECCVSTPVQARNGPRLELDNPLDLSSSAVLTDVEEQPIDLSTRAKASIESTAEAIDLALLRTLEQTISPVIPLDLRTTNISQLENQDELVSSEQASVTKTEESSLKSTKSSSSPIIVSSPPNAQSLPFQLAEKTFRGNVSQAFWPREIIEPIPSCSPPKRAKYSPGISSRLSDMPKSGTGLTPQEADQGMDFIDEFHSEDAIYDVEGDPTLLNDLSIYEYFEECQYQQTDDSSYSPDDSDTEAKRPSWRRKRKNERKNTKLAKNSTSLSIDDLVHGESTTDTNKGSK